MVNTAWLPTLAHAMTYIDTLRHMNALADKPRVRAADGGWEVSFTSWSDVFEREFKESAA